MIEKTIFWDKENVSEELHLMLEALGDEYAIREGFDNDGINVSFERHEEEGTSITTIHDNEAKIKYSSIATAARGIGSILSGLEENGKTTLKTFGIMLDCSRNAVMKVDHVKKWLRKLALMGYNMVMLYTEDTYQLPGEPFFGYLRGAYTMDEIKELDIYSAALGIEMIGCIQTLGHLEQILRWREYESVKDTKEVLMVDQDETYKLINKMLQFWKEALKTRRIHIGMDETQGLGLGKFFDKFGYERGFDIFNRHLKKVNKMCEENDLKAMIWSDMYFRMGCESGSYYDESTVIPEDVKNKIPENVDLVYWDYYHDNKEFYIDWIKRHRDLGFEPLMGSGIWTWPLFWYDHQQTVKTTKPCIEACKETGIRELFFTLWGDDGAYCEFDSALAGLCWAAELVFGGKDCEETLNRRFESLSGDSYSDYIKAGQIQKTADPFNDQNNTPDQLIITSSAILWDDPLLGIHWRDKLVGNNEYWHNVQNLYADILKDFTKYDTEIKSESLKHAYTVINALKKKIEFRQALLDAYSTADANKLLIIRDEFIPDIVDTLKKLQVSMRRQWMRRNKRFGFEVIQNRINALIGRYEETAVVITELTAGEICCIPELEIKLDDETAYQNHVCHYTAFASGSTCRWH